MQPRRCDVRADTSEPISSTATRAHPRAHDAPACVACSAHAVGDSHGAMHAFGGPHRLPQAVEAIARAIGCCAEPARQRNLGRAYLFAERQSVPPMVVEVQRERRAQARHESGSPATSAQTAAAQPRVRLNGIGGVR